MKKTSVFAWAIVFIIASTGMLSAEIGPPEEGGVLPEITLSVPASPEHRQYLGFNSTVKTFQIPQIKTEVVLVEIFSMYCPYCQKDAPVVNELYDKLIQNEKLKDKIKLIGIGAGNSAFEVDFFSKTYNIRFPLFSDADFSIHKKLGEVRTPYFIGVRIKKDGTHHIFYSKRGEIKNASEFLDLIIDRAGF